MKLTPRALCILPLAFALGGCAQVVGIDDFTVGDPLSGSSNGTSMGDPCVMAHGCTRKDALDLTGDLGKTVNVGFDAEKYTPRCVRIRSDTKIDFNSTFTFADIPITGGTYPTPDPKSPIQQPANEATHELLVSFPTGCGFPYFSPPNGETMNGVIFVGGP